MTLLADAGTSFQHAANGSLLLAVPVALLAGLVSFLSPCVLPLVPGYLSYVTGLSGADLAADTYGAGSETGGGDPQGGGRRRLGDGRSGPAGADASDLGPGVRRVAAVRARTRPRLRQ